MKKILTIIALFFCFFASAQNAHMIIGRTIIRYPASVTPVDYCINGVCSYLFRNGNNDTLAVIYPNGMVDMRVNVSIKDTLNSVSIIDVTGILSATRTLFNGAYAVSFNANNYYVPLANSKPPFEVRAVSNKSLYVIIGENSFVWWRQAMPSIVTVTTNIKRFTLP